MVLINFFVNVGANLAKGIRSPVNIHDVLKCMGDAVGNSMYVKESTEHEILDIVKNLKGKDSRDCYGLSMNVVKQLVGVIVKPFTHACNLSLNTGVFPDCLKLAKVVPLYKKGCPLEFSNYRPVSLLPQFSKVLEKAFYNRLVDFVESSGILHASQYGFRKGISTSHALIDIVDKISKSIDDKQYTIGVFLDLKKCFDTVNHTVLLAKIERLGVRGVALNWIKSYMRNRQQFVYYNSTESDKLSITCGVPQGSVLSPLLFLLFANDLARVSGLIKPVLFADDTNLFFSGPHLESLVRTVNVELLKIEKWFQVNRLFINADKTNFMVFSSAPCSADIEIRLCNNVLQRVTVCRFLGVLIDSHLTWKEHVHHITNKLYRYLSIMNRVGQYLPVYAKRTLYCSLFLPYITYCCEVWGTTYKTTLQPIITCQKKAIRIIIGAARRTHSSPLFAKLRLLKFCDIVSLQVCLIMYDGHKGYLPKNVQNSICKHDENKRNARVFRIQYCRTNTRQFSTLVYGSKLYNSLDNELQQSNCKLSLKTLFKKGCFLLYSTS